MVDLNNPNGFLQNEENTCRCSRDASKLRKRNHVTRFNAKNISARKVPLLASLDKNSQPKVHQPDVMRSGVKISKTIHQWFTVLLYKL